MSTAQTWLISFIGAGVCVALSIALFLAVTSLFEDDGGEV